MKKPLTLLFILLSLKARSQQAGLDGFVQLPQVVNYRPADHSVGYTPVASAGFTLHYHSAFAHVGSFINKQDVFGYNTYFESRIRSRPGNDGWQLVTNWLGKSLTSLHNRIPGCTRRA